MGKAARTFVVGALVIGIVLTCSTGCRRKTHQQIQIGAILPLTGPGSSFGKSSQNAVLLVPHFVNVETN
jgi:ABC-type branched-subunit amino acid transport system substrate-binding protein